MASPDTSCHAAKVAVSPSVADESRCTVEGEKRVGHTPSTHFCNSTASRLEAPALEEKCPAEQLVHVLAPELVEYWPGKQVLQAAADEAAKAVEYWPAKQLPHAVEETP